VRDGRGRQIRRRRRRSVAPSPMLCLSLLTSARRASTSPARSTPGDALTTARPRSLCLLWEEWCVSARRVCETTTGTRARARMAAHKIQPRARPRPHPILTVPGPTRLGVAARRRWERATPWLVDCCFFLCVRLSCLRVRDCERTRQRRLRPHTLLRFFFIPLLSAKQKPFCQPWPPSCARLSSCARPR
jgi:hypothetical protein